MKKMMIFLAVSFFVTGAAFAKPTDPDDIACGPVVEAVKKAKNEAEAQAEAARESFKEIKDGRSGK